MIPGIQYLVEMQEKVVRLEHEVERQSNSITRYLNVNNNLWNALMKLPGGAELARKISL